MTIETTPLDAHALRKSFKEAADADPEFFATLYERLHQEHPELWDQKHTPHFPALRSRGMRLQIDKLGLAIADTLDHITDSGYLAKQYRWLGRRHQQMGALDGQWVDAVGDALIWTFVQALGDKWTPYLAAQWAQAYFTLIRLMRAGAAESK